MISKKVLARLMEFTLGFGEYASKSNNSPVTTRANTPSTNPSTQSVNATSSTSSVSSTTSVESLSIKAGPQNLTHMLELLSIIIRSCKTETDIPDSPPPPTQLPGPVFTLSMMDQELLFGKVCFYVQ